MKHLFVVFLVFAAAFFPLHAKENYTIESLNFLPHEFYVGDEVELRLKVKVAEGIAVGDPEGELPSGEWLEITRTRRSVIREGICEISIYFVTYRPGVNYLPKIRFKDLALSSLEVDTRSILDNVKSDKLRPSRGQLELPDTYAKIIVNILLLVVVPLLLAGLGIFLYRVLIAFNRYRKTTGPYRKLKSACLKLLKKVDTINPRLFFITIIDLLKEYFSRRLLIPALCLTTGELTSFMQCSVFREETSQIISALLKRSDSVKFGGGNSTPGELRSVIEEVLSVADTMEDKRNVES
ncbi:MAG: hypothetical protein JW969_11860 [Spirochaetales bacterium]|nr:hypothetical protein [Spirochaetales bacterium]